MAAQTRRVYLGGGRWDDSMPIRIAKRVDAQRSGEYDTYQTECPEHWLTASRQQKLEEEADVLYGDSPRRICGKDALDSTVAAPMMSCRQTAGPFPEGTAKWLTDQAWFHFPESESTMYIGAWRIGERTWHSSPVRALIETAYYATHYRDPEWLLSALLSSNFKLEEAADIAERAEMNDGLRRLASISELVFRFDDKGGYPWMSELRDYAEKIDGEVIPVCAGSGWFPVKEGWEDRKYGVIWNVDREETADELIPC